MGRFGTNLLVDFKKKKKKTPEEEEGAAAYSTGPVTSRSTSIVIDNA